MRKVFRFLGEVRVELSKVVWPTRARAFRLSIIVIIVSLISGAALSGIDYGLSKGVKYSIDTAQKRNAPAAPAPGTSETQTIPVGPEGAPGQPGAGSAPVTVPGAAPAAPVPVP